MGLADRDYMKGVSAPSAPARPGLWLRLRFALWQAWQRLRPAPRGGR